MNLGILYLNSEPALFFFFSTSTHRPPFFFYVSCEAEMTHHEAQWRKKRSASSEFHLGDAQYPLYFCRKCLFGWAINTISGNLQPLLKPLGSWHRPTQVKVLESVVILNCKLWKPKDNQNNLHTLKMKCCFVEKLCKCLLGQRGEIFTNYFYLYKNRIR